MKPRSKSSNASENNLSSSYLDWQVKLWTEVFQEGARCSHEAVEEDDIDGEAVRERVELQFWSVLFVEDSLEVGEQLTQMKPVNNRGSLKI